MGDEITGGEAGLALAADMAALANLAGLVAKGWNSDPNVARVVSKLKAGLTARKCKLTLAILDEAPESLWAVYDVLKSETEGGGDG